jgi:hypothetical protein
MVERPASSGPLKFTLSRALTQMTQSPSSNSLGRRVRSRAGEGITDGEGYVLEGGGGRELDGLLVDLIKDLGVVFYDDIGGRPVLLDAVNDHGADSGLCLGEQGPQVVRAGVDAGLTEELDHLEEQVVTDREELANSYFRH